MPNGQANSIKNRGRGLAGQSRAAKVAILAYSLVLAASLLVGWHIVYSGNVYGTVEENYLQPFTWLDLPALAALTAVLWVVLLGIFALMKRRFDAGPEPLEAGGAQEATASASVRATFIQPYCHNRISLKWLAVGAAIFFLAWLPYLLVYWPGLVFGDTTLSISQVLNWTAYSNHHPVFFTLLIRACFSLTARIGLGITAGCALYCLCQMIAMALIFSYQICWLRARFRAHTAFCVIALAVLAFCPYIATYSIAMWKDPLFCSVLVVITLQLADAVLTDFSPSVVNARFAAFLGFTALAMCLLRGNGIYLLVLVLVVMGIAWLVRRHRDTAGHEALTSPRIKVACSLLGAIILAWAITGPLYTAAGVAPSERAESLGVPLAQMARVAATDGSMTDSDRDYLNSLLPLGEYATAYRPCIIDSLKWSEAFNSSALENGFWQHWLSLLVQNPGTYLEAWALQTFGFWAADAPSAVAFDDNITYGVPHYAGEEVMDLFGIQTQNLLGSNEVKAVLTLESPFVPISIIFWALVYLAICMALLGKARWIMIVLPSLALMATIVIASPIWYWPRYAAALQFLLPTFIVLFPACCLPSGRAAG